MALRSGLTVIDSARIDEVVAEATAENATIYMLSVPEPADRLAFFDAVRGTLPLDPPLAGSRSWDALSDSLWEGLRILDATTFVIIWSNAYSMREARPNDHQIALAVLQDVATSLSDSAATVGHPKKVCVYAVARSDSGE